MKVGWIGIGRMGFEMATRLLAAGYDVKVWNRTRAKAEPLAARGATIAREKRELADVDVLFTMLSTGKDLIDVCFGGGGMFGDGASAARPRLVVDASTIAVSESAEVRARLKEQGVQFLAAPVSGNPKCIRAGKLSCVSSGPREAFDQMRPLLETYAPRGATYAGEGEEARICKIAVNLMLQVVTENMMEATLLAHKAGVPRHAFLGFVNNSVVGSIYTRYKAPALINLDWTTTFTLIGSRKDMDLGLSLARELEVPMPVTAATREMLQAHFGVATLQPDPDAYLHQDYSTYFETMALMAGVKLESERVEVSDGLEPEPLADRQAGAADRQRR